MPTETLAETVAQVLLAGQVRLAVLWLAVFLRSSMLGQWNVSCATG